MVSMTRRASSSAPLPPSPKAVLTAKPTPSSAQCSATSAISSSVSVAKRLKATTTVWPKLRRFSMWRSRFASPRRTPSRLGSLSASSATPPCIFSPPRVATSTVSAGLSPAARHLML